MIAAQKIHLKLIALLPLFVVAIGWMLSSNAESIFIPISGGMIVVGFVLALLSTKRWANLILAISSLSLSYLAAEGIYYILQPLDRHAGFNKLCTELDLVRGYRWTDTDIRTFKVFNGEVSYDNTFHTNNVGWVMNQDYSFQKKDSTVQRWIILGDSFTAGIMLKNNLPNQMQEIFNAKSAEIELYAFGVDGGGIMNWYSTFFNEVVPNYEFDGVILATYEDNLTRGFTVFDLDQEKSCYARFDSIPKTLSELRRLADQSASKKSRFHYEDDEIEAVIADPGKTFKWGLKRKAYLMLKGLQNTHSNGTSSLRTVERVEHLWRKMGATKSAQLQSMIKYCKNQNKPMVIASIPSIHLLKERKDAEANRHQHEINLVSNSFNLPSFDGYKVFEHLNEEEVQSHWLKNDGHWNQKGSDAYAHALSEYLINFVKSTHQP